MADDPTDGELVERVLRGDHGAFDLLYKRYAVVVRRVVARELADRDEQLDVVQDVFIRVFDRLPALREPDRFAGWVTQMARNAAIDKLRSRQRRRTDYDDELLVRTEATDPTPVDLNELRDMAARLKSGMALLSQRDATALSLAVELGFGPDELGAALGITANNAKVVLHRARRRLKAALEIDDLVEGFAMAPVTEV
ncbi:MAG: RNA polymerase sigma factor [Acidimicrobiia bacterium]